MATARVLRIATVLLSLLLGTAAADAADVVETVRQRDKFETLVKAIEAAGGMEWVKEERHVTLFAPTDAAFDKRSKGVLDRLLEPEHRDELELRLEHHVVPDKTLTAADLRGEITRLEMAEGEPLLVDAIGGSIQIGDATAVQTDIRADNGIVHVIDKAPVPELVWNMLERSE